MLERSQVVAVDVDKAFAFFADAGNLEKSKDWCSITPHVVQTWDCDIFAQSHHSVFSSDNDRLLVRQPDPS